jgi:hypothetical protein
VDRFWEYINHSQTHECGNWSEATQFPGKEYINKIFVAVRGKSLDPGVKTPWGVNRLEILYVLCSL